MRELDFPILSLLVLFNAIYFVRAEDAAPLTEEWLANRINAYGSDLLNGLYGEAGPDDNLLVSPVNMYAALALLHLGAGAKTRDELAVILKLSDKNDSSELHHQLKAVMSTLATKSEGKKFYETVLANGIFLQNSFPIKESYVELANNYYASVAKNVDFHTNPQESTNVINKWISENTRGRISKFYDEPLSSDTIAVLISVLYFNAKWLDKFSPDGTKTETFKTHATEIQTPMMNKVFPAYYESDQTLHYDSVSLPYSGKEYEMKIYLQHQEQADHDGNLAHLFRELSRKISSRLTALT